MAGLHNVLQIGATSVGIDVGGATIKAVELRRTARGLELHHFGMAPVPSGTVDAGLIVDREALAGAVTELLRTAGIRTRRAVIAVTGQNVLARVLRLPPIPDTEVKQAIRWEAERHLPFSVDEAVLDATMVREVTDNGLRQIEVLLAAAPESHVLAYIEAMEAARIFVDAVEVGALAMARALSGATSSGTHALINLGVGITDVAVVRDGVPQFTRTIALGTGYDPTLVALDEPISQVRRTLDFYRAQFSGATIHGMIICGSGASIPHIAQHLTGELELPVSIGNPFSAIRTGAKLDLNGMQSLAPQLTVATGLALRAIA